MPATTPGTPPTGDGVPEGSEPARVIRIVDGDTVWLRGDGDDGDDGEGGGLVPAQGIPVRLLEIDTPETVAPGQPVECWGPEASRVLERLIPVGSRVWVQPDRDLMDPYDRMLLYLWNHQGRFVNLEMVRAGAAEAVLYEPNDRYIERLREAERRARAEGRGRWGRC